MPKNSRSVYCFQVALRTLNIKNDDFQSFQERMNSELKQNQEAADFDRATQKLILQSNKCSTSLDNHIIKYIICAFFNILHALSPQRCHIYK